MRHTPKSLLIGTLTTAALCGLAPGCIAPERGVPALKQGEIVDRYSARLATERGDWERAAARWNELFLRGGGDRAEACYETARALQELGDCESARSILDLGLTQSPDHPDLHEMRGNVLICLGFRRAAEVAYEEALAIDPKRPSTLLALACLQFELGREASAIRSLERRIELGATDPRTFQLFGSALRKCGHQGQALEAFTRSIELGAADLTTLVAAGSLAVDLALTGAEVDTALALDWLDRARELDPQCTAAHFQYGRLLLVLGREDEAIAPLRRAVETDPAHLPALLELAELHHRRGELEPAADLARRALKLETRPLRRAQLRRIVDEAPPPERRDPRHDTADAPGGE